MRTLDVSLSDSVSVDVCCDFADGEEVEQLLEQTEYHVLTVKRWTSIRLVENSLKSFLLRIYFFHKKIIKIHFAIVF